MAFLSNKYGAKVKDFVLKKVDTVTLVIGILVLIGTYFVTK